MKISFPSIDIIPTLKYTTFLGDNPHQRLFSILVANILVDNNRS